MIIQKASVRLSFKVNRGKKSHLKTFLEANTKTKTFLLPHEGCKYMTTKLFSFFLTPLILHYFLQSSQSSKRRENPHVKSHS